MVSQTNEQALEAAIEKKLCGASREEIKQHVGWPPQGNQPIRSLVALDPAGHGYEMGLPSDFNATYALDEKLFWRFLEQTQASELDKLRRNGASDWQRKVLERFDRLMKKHGLLYLLKKGLAVDDAFLTLMYPAPLASSSATVSVSAPVAAASSSSSGGGGGGGGAPSVWFLASLCLLTAVRLRAHLVATENRNGNA